MIASELYASGAQQLYVCALLLVPCFWEQVELQHGGLTMADLMMDGADTQTVNKDEKEDVPSSAPLGWTDNETSDVKAIMQRLSVIYSWAKETFAALDLQTCGTVDLNQTGPTIYKLFSHMKISHLWDTLTKVLDGEAVVTLERFNAVFFLWMGIDEQFELSCQRGMSQRPDAHQCTRCMI